MGRRHRHLNPLHLGATSALDARFLTGFSNNDPVTTWASRTGTNAPTQATAGNRPLYQSAGINGNPSILFSGALKRFDYSSNPIAAATAASAVSASTRTTVGPGALVAQFGNSPSGADHAPFSDGNYYISFGSTTRYFFAGPTVINVPVIESCVSASGSWIWRAAGIIAHTSAANTVAIGPGPRIGANNTLATWSGHAGAVAVFPLALTAPNRKRAEHSMAYSFKIPCS